jgi:hypothetical protein
MKGNRIVSILVLAAIVAALFASAVPAFAAGTILSTDPKFINAGDTVVVDLKINTDQKIIGWQADVSYNPAVVKLNSWTEDTSWLKAYAVANGGDSFRVAGTINNTTGNLIGASVAGLGIPAGQGATGSGVLGNLSFTALANGKAQLTFANVCLVLPNNTCLATQTLSPSFIQVGPAPQLQVSSVVFTPAGNQGQIFNAKVTVANVAAAAYPGGDQMTFAVTNATPASPAAVTLPAIGANASASFDLTGLTLNAGAQNATLVATIAAFVASKSGVYSPVSDSANTNVDANFGAFLKIAPDAAISFGSLALGDNTKAGSVNVKCNTNYEVDVYDNNASTWHMTEWDGAAFKSIKLADPMHIISAQSDVTAASAAMLVTGGVAGQSGDAGQTHNLTYKQTVHYADPLLPAGETYHLIVTFNAFVTM